MPELSDVEAAAGADHVRLEQLDPVPQPPADRPNESGARPDATDPPPSTIRHLPRVRPEDEHQG